MLILLFFDESPFETPCRVHAVIYTACQACQLMPCANAYPDNLEEGW